MSQQVTRQIYGRISGKWEIFFDIAFIRYFEIEALPRN